MPTSGAVDQEAFARAVAAERLRNSRVGNAIRLVGSSCFLGFLVVFGRVLDHPIWRVNLTPFVVYSALAIVVWAMRRRSDRFAGVTMLALPFIDVPAIFVFMRELLATIPPEDHQGPAMFALAFWVWFVAIAGLSLRRWLILLTATVSAVLAAAIQLEIGAPLEVALVGVLLLALAAATSTSATRRVEALVHAVVDVQAEKMASLQRLVAGAAHEINNPVSLVVGNLEPLRERLGRLRTLAESHHDPELSRLAERIEQAGEIIARGTERTARIVRDLRTFSGLEEAHRTPIDLHDSIEVTLRLLLPRWADRITIHRQYGSLPTFEAAAPQISQLLMNLLGNACDAIRGTGNIWIRTVCEGTSVSVMIRDDGAGIPAEHLHRIFDPFFTTKPQGDGTGLGLAIAQGIVAGHGGTINVASEPGRGSQFSIVLPIRGASASPPEPRAREM